MKTKLITFKYLRKGKQVTTAIVAKSKRKAICYFERFYSKEYSIV